MSQCQNVHALWNLASPLIYSSEEELDAGSYSNNQRVITDAASSVVLNGEAGDSLSTRVTDNLESKRTVYTDSVRDSFSLVPTLCHVNLKLRCCNF